MATTTAITKRAADILADKKASFLAVLPKDVQPERFYALAVAIAKDPKLATCTVSSVLDCVYRFAKLGLDPDPALGEGYVIPRNITTGKDASGQWQKVRMACFQPGYRGLARLARKSKGVADIHAEVVYEGEVCQVNLGTNRQINHVPWYATGSDEPQRIILAYATWRDLASGAMNFHVVSKTRIDRARAMNRDRDGNDSKVWQDDAAAMARKTAIIDASKFWPLTAELADAVDSEERIERDEPQTQAAPSNIVDGEVVAATSELDDFENPADSDSSIPSPEEQANIVAQEAAESRR